MCGIAGIYAYLDVAPKVYRAELARMNARMAPRGPDGSGDWYSSDERVGFTHRRLAINAQ
jgi:asparagine synthase (glutamine-hydrolysing)